MIIIAESRQLHMQEVLQHPLGPLPSSLATSNGLPRKTNKAQLGRELEKLVQPTAEIPSPSVRGTQRPICSEMYYYTPVNENKCYSGIFGCFSVLLGKYYLFVFPSKTHKKFPSQLIKFISQPGIPRAFKSLDPKRPNKSDKTGTKQVFSASAITLTSRRMFVTTVWEREGLLFFFFFFCFF